MKCTTAGISRFAVAMACLAASSAWGALSGTVPAVPGASVTPGLTSAAAGTLLASQTTQFITSTGTASGTLVSAVYANPGGTLDFYYQVTNDTTSTNCGGGGQPVCDSLVRLSGVSFFSFATALGYRTDGSSLPNTPFVNGTVVPVEGDRDSAGPAIGFSFYPTDSAKIHPGSTSRVLIVSTDATTFAAGSATVSDGGFSTLAVFQPSGHNLLVVGGSPAATEAAAFSGTVATFMDTDTAQPLSNFSATIDWGDGTGTSAGTITASKGIFSVSGSHTFADEGSFSGSVSVTDAADNLTKTVPVTFTVAEGDSLGGSGVNFSATQGVAFSGSVANFTDTNTANVPSDFTATVDWGDGSTTAGTVSGGAGAFAVSGTHTYTFFGLFTVKTTLNDDAPGTATLTVQSNAAVAGSEPIPMQSGLGLLTLGAAIALIGVLSLKGIR